MKRITKLSSGNTFRIEHFRIVTLIFLSLEKFINNLSTFNYGVIYDEFS